jgi:hypothetical protein
MRLYEILVEAVAPIQPVAPVGAEIDADIAQQQQPQQPEAAKPTPVQIATALKKLAGGTPVKPTGNAGIDNLLFKVGGLSKSVGGIANAVGRGLNAIGKGFANNTSLQRTQFNKTPRRGADIARGIPQNPEDTKKISAGQKLATGIERVPMGQIDADDLVELFKDAAGGQPFNLTGNAGVDSVLTRTKKSIAQG